MDTMSQQSLEHKRHHHFGRHRSGSYLSRRTSSSSFLVTANTPSFNNAQPRIFQGTDAVPQNRRVALQRVIETHHALELKHGDSAQTPTSTNSDYRPTSSSSSSFSSSISNDPFTIDFSDMSFPDAEVRAFRYLLRKWDPSTCTPDPEFESAIVGRKEKFEESSIKHFLGRVALWDASAEEKHEAGMTRSVFFFRNRRRRSRAKSDVSRMLEVPEKEGEKEDEGLDALKEVTTREGLAQLLWTLVHTDRGLLGLRGECTGALKEMYRMTVMGVEMGAS